MDPIHVGSDKQLFLDDGLVESSTGIRATMHSPKRSGDVLVAPDAAWEDGSNIGLYCSVLEEDGLIRIWYFLSSDNVRCLCYCESEDGLHFRKPELGLHKLHGSRSNNVVIPGPDGGGSVWIDPKATGQGRYRSQAKSYPGWPDPGRSAEFWRYASPDGVHWRRLPVELGGDWDTQSICFWDDRVGRYVIYTRKWFRFDDRAQNHRAVRRLESDDLARWDGERVVMEADEIDLGGRETPTGQPPMDYYGALVFKYPGNHGLYVMLAQVFWHWQALSSEQRWGESGDPQKPVIERLGPGTIDVRLCWSRDGVKFHHVGDRQSFMATGPDGSFDSRMLWAMPNPVPLGDELAFYYAGTNADHHGFVDPVASGRRSGIGRALLRMDGFVSLDAGSDEGEVVTRPLTFDGAGLELNMETRGDGCVRVGLLDEHGQPMEGHSLADAVPLCGNCVRMKARWATGGDLAAFAARPVRLQFKLRSARMYAFQFVERP